MSIRFDANDEYLLFTGTSLGMADGTVSWSMGVWVKLISDQNIAGGIIAFGETRTPTTNYGAADVAASGVTSRVRDTNSSATGGDLTVGNWYWTVLSRSGDTLRVRIFDDTTSTTPAVDITTSHSPDDTVADTLIVGCAGTGEWADAEFALCKHYVGAEWTNTECRTESQKLTMQKAGGSPSWVWRLEDTDADTNGLNELGGSGPNFSNTGGVEGASRPSQLEALLTSAQDAFRFYNDDGDEDASTPMANENVDISVAKNTPFRLRIGSTFTGDPPAIAVTLQYKKSGDPDSEWETVT